MIYCLLYTSLPEDEWVELTFIGELNKTSLYVNGEFIETINKSNGGKVGTFILPLDKIGSSTNSFKGSIDEITIKDGAHKIVDPTVIPQEQMSATASSCLLYTSSTKEALENVTLKIFANNGENEVLLKEEKIDSLGVNESKELTFEHAFELEGRYSIGIRLFNSEGNEIKSENKEFSLVVLKEINGGDSDNNGDANNGGDSNNGSGNDSGEENKPGTDKPNTCLLYTSF